MPATPGALPPCDELSAVFRRHGTRTPRPARLTQLPLIAPRGLPPREHLPAQCVLAPAQARTTGVGITGRRAE
jgi:hypothetical protein